MSWVILMLISLTPVQGKWLSENFQFRVDSYKVNYSLTRRGNYIRFHYMGKEKGFYIKPCHQRLIKTLNNTFDEVSKDLVINFHAKEGESLPNGKVTMNSRVFPYFRELGKQTQLQGLEEKIATYIQISEKQCTKK
ncbi:MAG: hypothetical protein NXH75_03805 [Halobacteriovoraceae bacterium]|nr:hypothetical protein [Halobacteriovoraceae bacterium]